MENDKPAQHRYGSAIKLLSCLSAAWCAIAIIVVGTFLVSSIGSQVLETLGHPDTNIAEFAGGIVWSWPSLRFHRTGIRVGIRTFCPTRNAASVLGRAARRMVRYDKGHGDDQRIANRGSDDR